MEYLWKMIPQDPLLWTSKFPFGPWKEEMLSVTHRLLKVFGKGAETKKGHRFFWGAAPQNRQFNGKL